MSRRILPAVFALVFGGFITEQSCYANDAVQKSPQIEYIAPDGQLSCLSAAHSAIDKSSAAFIDRDTISCALREGKTTLIIELPKNSPPDRFTLLNENADACGELRIAVSDSPLPFDSPRWIEVEGIVPFAHKRLFKLSMLGVETKFVRLSFKVDRPHQDSARISDPFRISFLAAEIGSNLSSGHQREIDLSFATSVGALSTKQN